MPARRVGYIDASAFVKLALHEPGHEALDTALAPWHWVSSALLEVEAVGAARRRALHAADAARALLALVDLVDIDTDICRAASELAGPGLRALDAIHLATALSLGERCGAFFAYDERLIDAARAHGLTVTVPRP